jgi:hypothetical protein
MQEEQYRGQLALELHFRDEQVKTASFAPVAGGNSGLFSCSLGPLSEADVGELERAARLDTPIRLRFSEYPLLLDQVTVERKGPQSVRIVGRVVRAAG